VSHLWGMAKRSSCDQRRWSGENRTAFEFAEMKACESVAGLACVRWDLFAMTGLELNVLLERRARSGSLRDENWFHVPVRGKISAGSWRV